MALSDPSRFSHRSHRANPAAGPPAPKAFSKKLANHRGAIALWVCFYNLCRVHETLRCTPAMALGVTDHICTIGELMAAAQEPTDAPPLPPITRPDTLGERTTFKLYVISGGRAAPRQTRR
jgi:hypothetical protein